MKQKLFALSAWFTLAWVATCPAQSWPGWTDDSLRLRTRTFDFGAPGGSNENYYDGDFADFDGDYRMDRAAISRYGLLWNTGDGFLTPVSTQRIDPATGQASGPQSLRSYTGYRFGDGYAGNDAVQWADIDGDGDPDSIQGGNGEPFVIQSNRAGRFYETWRASGSALNITTTDVEGDGDVDLAVAHAFCSNRDCTGPVDFRLWINDGSGRFTDEASARGLPYAADLIVGVVSGDVDRDGDFDLVLLNGIRRQVLVMLNDGTGRYTERVTPFARPVADIIAFGGGFGQMPCLGDIDDDGDLDLVIALGGNNDADTPTFNPVGLHAFVSHVIMINDGAGNFVEDPSRWLVSGLPRALVAENGKLIDVDHDGDLDFLAFTKPGPDFFQVFLNDGAGNFTYRPDLDPVAWAPPRTNSTGVDLDIADIDGDGTLDTWVGIAGFPPTTLLNAHRDPSGLRADWPRAARLVVADAGGVTLSWQHPPWAATNRRYRVLRTTAPGTEPRDRQVLHDIALSVHEDDSFAAPLTRFTTTAELADPDVVLDGAQSLVTFTDRTALPGVTYWYSLVHVGTERNASLPTREIRASIPLPDPTAADTTAPELTILSPTWQEWGTHPRVVVSYGDGQSGVDAATLEVRFDAPLGDGTVASGGLPAGGNLARQRLRWDAGTYVDRLDRAQALGLGLTTLTVRVADRAGNVAERRVTFDVSLTALQPPAAAMNATLRAGTQIVDFDAGTSVDVDGIVMKWEWAFGDGMTAEGRRVTHRYRNPGDHDVLLVVRDDDGAVDQLTRTVTVFAADPDTDADGLTDAEELDGDTDPDRADTDGDGTLDGADCLPSDAIDATPPPEVAGLRVRGAAAGLLSWDAPLVPDPTLLVYDVAVGLLSELRTVGPLARPACLLRDATSLSTSDGSPAPVGGAYYLVRAVSACPRAGSQWGNDSLGRPRGSSTTCP